ncbi:uncharacterized protein LOC113230669 isoform X1 [Hyposmocoma kahamanoa]|uniref:uncharacterized protein LOC113230669 isoform X1 n=1 Tax=Hyposmocoma kahamanoa TaxID=1477025 RepID=UPI000E6D77AD|nr:uncharacterized protein LOC113230669 isoform X1 [Hyposmocoma kahamanoa]
MLKKFIILIYLALSRGSAEFDQFAGFDFAAPSVEQNSQFDLTPSTTTDLSDTIIENSFPTSDNTVEIFPPHYPAVINALSSDTIVGDFLLTNDTAIEMFPISDSNVTNSPSSDTAVGDSYLSNDTTVEIFPPNDSNVKNSRASDTIVGDSFSSNDTAVEIIPSSDSTIINGPLSDTIVENSFQINDTAVEIFPLNNSTIKNTSLNNTNVVYAYPTSETAVENSFPINNTDVEIFPLSNPTIKNTPSSDTIVENVYPTSETAVENSLATDLTDKNAHSIDTIVENSPPTSYTTVEDSPSTHDTMQNTTSKTTVFIDNNEWGNAPADLEPLINNYPCSKKDCPNNYKTTYKPLDLGFILTRIPRADTRPLNDVQQPDCPVEPTIHIGSFVVPSKQDITKTMRKLLQNTFSNYRNKTISFLEDIDKARKTMIDEEKSCFNKTEYHECVEHVSSGTKMITSSLLHSMDNTMKNIEFLYESLKCNLSDPATVDDPIKLIKLIASETATIDFAMPGYLRLLYTCFRFCERRSEDITSIGMHSHPENFKKLIQPQPQATSRLDSNPKDSRHFSLHLSSRPHYKKLRRMITLKVKPSGGFKYLNVDRISYIKNIDLQINGRRV